MIKADIDSLIDDEVNNTNEEDGDDLGLNFKIPKLKYLMVLVISLIVLIVLTLLVVNSINYFKKSNITTPSEIVSELPQDTQTQPSEQDVLKYSMEGVIVDNSSINFDNTVEVDYLILEKYMVLNNGNVTCIFKGETTKSKRSLKFEVPCTTYNSYQSGQILKLEYKVVVFDDISYATDINVKGVVGE